MERKPSTNVTFFQFIRCNVCSMKKEIIISALALFLIVSPAFAQKEGPKENSPKNNQNNNQNHKKDSDSSVQALTDPISPTITPIAIAPSISPTLTITPEIVNTHKPKKEKDEDRQASPSASPACSPEKEYRNHGEYVSCVAREHRGGKEVSDAARSDIGKKHEENDDNDDPSPTITPTVTSTISPTISPITFGLPTIHGGFNPFTAFRENFQRFFGFLMHFI